jgi:hypothetical protein
LQAFLLASSKEALRAALESVADATGEDLLARFSSALTSWRKSTRAQRKAASETSQSQRSSCRARSVESQGSGDEDFSGIENIPTLRKLHQLCVWLRSSTIHTAAWDRQVGLRLGIDNQTRWSSWYAVIDRAIRKMVAIKVFMNDNERSLNNIRLTSDDWDILQKAHAFLQPFASATLYAEGDKASISQSLLIMDSLLVHYEQQKVSANPLSSSQVLC